MLTEADLPKVRLLVELCAQHDGRAMPMALATPAEPCLALASGTVIGYFEYMGTGGMNEGWGMVHPEHRQKGVGRALLDSLRTARRATGRQSFTLVCDKAIPSGDRFARAIGATYESSEHRMELKDRGRISSSGGPLRIRAGTSADVLDFARVHAAAYTDSSFEEQRASAAELYSESNRRFYLADLNGDTIGTVATCTMPEESCVFIVGLAVVREHQGRGYGRQILAWTVDRLIHDGFERIMIEVFSDNSRAINLYLSCGFDYVTTYDYYRVPTC